MAGWCHLFSTIFFTFYINYNIIDVEILFFALAIFETNVDENRILVNTFYTF